jgi:predicted ATPase/class 3 adenylate cyclase
MQSNFSAEEKNVTFLFTEVKASDRLWNSDPEAMASAVAVLAKALSEEFSTTGGQVFKSTGAAFCVAYSNPMDAARCALRIQAQILNSNSPATASAQASDRRELKVCIAILSGTAQQIGDEYVGRSVNRTARLLEVGHGGQILAGPKVVEATSSAVDFSWRDLGSHRLRDLLSPMRIHQMTASGLPITSADLDSLSHTKTNLPEQVTPFVSRGTEIHICKDLLQQRRMLTLVGFGGAGKTRLALQVAAELAKLFPGGTYFIDLGQVKQAEAVSTAICHVLGVNFTSEFGALDALTAFLKKESPLLVLDSCELMAEPTGQIIEHLVRSVPALKILATSRVPLGVSGEQRYMVSSLSLPNLGDSMDAIATSGAVQFFNDRACASQPAYTMTWETAPVVTEICRRLDGIPLALELVAARLRDLPPNQILDRLDQSLLALRTHHSPATWLEEPLQAAIEWSIDLLNDREKTVFRRLAVFVTSWSLPAAEAVSADSDIDSIDVFDGLHSLVEKSLTNFSGDDQYSWLQTIREFSIQMLVASNEERAIRERHLQYYSRYISGEIVPARSDDPKIRAELDRELPNIFAAIEYACSSAIHGKTENLDLAEKLASWLFPYWNLVGRLSEGVRVGLEVLNHPAQQPCAELVRLLIETGGAAYSVFDYSLAETLLSRAEAISNELGLEALSMEALRTRGEAEVHQGRLSEGRTILQTAAERYQAANDFNGAAICFRSLGYVARETGEFRLAQELTERALAIHTDFGDASGRLWCVGSLGSLAMELGELDRARQNFEQALAMHEAIENFPGIAWNCNMLADLALRQGRLTEAIELLERSLKILDRDKETGLKSWPLGLLGEAFSQTGDLTRAILAFEQVVEIGQEGTFGKSEGLALLRLCELHLKQGHRATAMSYFEIAKNLSDRLEVAGFQERFQEIATLIVENSSPRAVGFDTLGN